MKKVKKLLQIMRATVREAMREGEGSSRND